MFPRDEEYRNPRLLELCRAVPCQSGRLHCRGGATCAAHSNQAIHGKGGKRKAHDCFVASLCAECHFEVDDGKSLLRERRVELWTEAWERTFLLLWESGRIVLPEVDAGPFAARWLVLPYMTSPDEWLAAWRSGQARVT